MKKIVAIVLVLVMMLAFASCGDKNEIIGVMPFYVGETVMEENHEFKAEDFSVWVAYEEGQNLVKDFKFEVVDFTNGVYTVNITYGGWTEPCFVTIGEEKGE